MRRMQLCVIAVGFAFACGGEPDAASPEQTPVGPDPRCDATNLVEYFQKGVEVGNPGETYTLRGLFHSSQYVLGGALSAVKSAPDGRIVYEFSVSRAYDGAWSAGERVAVLMPRSMAITDAELAQMHTSRPSAFVVLFLTGVGFSPQALDGALVTTLRTWQGFVALTPCGTVQPFAGPSLFLGDTQSEIEAEIAAARSPAP